MNLIRNVFDVLYDTVKPFMFSMTKEDPEKAHELFAGFCQFLYKSKLEKILLDNKANYIIPSFKISNAAGFNKNAEIPPSVLKYLGFDRVVVGAVTYKVNEGNPRPRIKRYDKTESLVNWMNFPSLGAEFVVGRLSDYENHNVPLTINIATSDKKNELLIDLEKTVKVLKSVLCVDRFELDVSCPSINKKYPKKVIKEMINMIYMLLSPGQDLYLKVSPDLAETEIDEILDISQDYVKGFTTTNTTISHNPVFIPNSPGKGGASGDAVYNNSLRVQKLFYEKIKKQNKNLRIIACGGINSMNKVRERLYYGASEIQIYTPLIFSGPKLLRKLRMFEIIKNSPCFTTS